MRLIIGGAHQGKRNFAAAQYGIPKECIRNACELSETGLENAACVSHFHLLVKRLLQENQNPAEFTRQMLQVNPDVIIIMDEIGCGIIPLEKSERVWREEVGRIGCFLAERAESVERIVCGMAVKIK